LKLSDGKIILIFRHAITVDGHNVTEIIKALDVCKTIKGKPQVILLKTFKGRYFTDLIEDKNNWHGKPVTLKNSEIIRANLNKMIKTPNLTLTTHMPEFKKKWEEECSLSKYTITPNYKKDEKVSTRVAYGNGLKKLGDQDKNDHIMAFDCDVKNSTYSETFEKAYPKKFANCFIAEQNMVSVALGVSKRNKIPFCSTFACFFTRAFDQIRMGAISFANVKFMGSHTGLHIGEDGPSQMGLEV
jgi:transketolase